MALQSRPIAPQGDVFKEVIIDCATKDDVDTTIKCIESLPSLSSIYISGGKDNVGKLGPVIEALRGAPLLTEFFLERMDISPALAKVVQEFFFHSKTARHLSVSDARFLGSDCITSLLCEMVKAVIRYKLTLTNVSFDAREVEELAGILGNPFCAIDNLVISRCRLRNSSIYILASGLSSCRSLRHLDISRNNLELYELTHIFHALTGNRTMQSISYQRNAVKGPNLESALKCVLDNLSVTSITCCHSRDLASYRKRYPHVRFNFITKHDL